MIDGQALPAIDFFIPRLLGCPVALKHEVHCKPFLKELRCNTSQDEVYLAVKPEYCVLLEG
jgi:hypothetical protein